MKLSLLKLSIISGSLLISYGCNTTEFADSSKKKPAGSIEAVSCSVSPKVVLPGKKVKVSINGGSNYRGRFEQKVVLSGSLIHRQVLSKQSSGFLPEDGLPNEFVFNEQGDYEVQLSELDYSSNLSTTCKFKVYKECPVGTERVGANVAFILDNSGSHGKSDCPGSKEVKKDDNTVAYTCNAETNREKAVNYAVEILGQVGSKGGKAISHVSSASFPEKNNVISGYDIGSSGWVNSSTESSKIAEDLKITRAPYGMTPYGEGLSATEALFASTPEISKPKVAIFVTDGLPTDQDPYISLQKANSLKASGVKIISILVSSKDKNSMITEHKSFLEGIGGEEKPWYSPDYTSYEQYFSSLLGDGSKEGLLVSMSDDVIYLKDSSELKNAFDSIIGEQTLSCK